MRLYQSSDTRAYETKLFFGQFGAFLRLETNQEIKDGGSKMAAV